MSGEGLPDKVGAAREISMPACCFQPSAYKGPPAEEVLAVRRQFLNPGIFLYYKKPLMLVEGRMQYVWDEAGRRYLDGLGGIVTVSVGHCHPHVVEAVRRQNETLQHSTTIYLHPNVSEYARILASKMPGDLKVFYFLNSGSEATDLALLMALYGEFRHHRFAQRISWGECRRLVGDRPQHLEVQRPS